MTSELAVLKLISDAGMTALQAMMTVQKISSILAKVHERGTPWSEADWAEVDAVRNASKLELEQARKEAGFI